jgi:hypothetical protein
MPIDELFQRLHGTAGIPLPARSASAAATVIGARSTDKSRGASAKIQPSATL